LLGVSGGAAFPGLGMGEEGWWARVEGIGKLPSKGWFLVEGGNGRCIFGFPGAGRRGNKKGEKVGSSPQRGVVWGQRTREKNDGMAFFAGMEEGWGVLAQPVALVVGLFGQTGGGGLFCLGEMTRSGRKS